MRCQEVVRQLSILAPGAPRLASLDDHLAGCVSCAGWAERNTRLDRLWEATRPPELSAAAWDRIWSKAAESFEPTRWVDSPVPAPAPAPAPASTLSLAASAPARSWRGSAAVVFSLAQAAALLFCLGLAWRQAPARRPNPPLTTAGVPKPPTAAGDEIPAFDISPDQLTLISLDDRTFRDLSTDENPNEVSLFSLPMFNAVESLASLQ